MIAIKKFPEAGGYPRYGWASPQPHSGLPNGDNRLFRLFKRQRSRQAEAVLGWLSPAIFLGPAQRRLFRHGSPIFAYHKIASPPRGTRDPFLYDPPVAFARQLAALRQAGYTSASLTQITGAGSHPDRRTVITFDDGCRNVFEQGLDSLTRYQFKAIQFLVPAFVGGRNEWDIAKGDVPENLMDESQIRQWLSGGHEIGSHSMTHRNLSRLPMSEAREEIRASKKALEDRFGVEVRHFSYPFGARNPAVRDCVREAGYHTACTMQFGVNSPATPPFELRRIFPLGTGGMLRKIRHRLLKNFHLHGRAF